MKIAFAADHAGYELKQQLIESMKNSDYEIVDFGTDSSASIDYPDYAFPASKAVAEGKADLGILVCGSGVGMSIVANKVKGIRAANCFETETAMLSRKHNNANVLTLGARFTDLATAKKIVEAFLTTDFEGGRHEKRVEKIHTLTGN